MLRRALTVIPGLTVAGVGGTWLATASPRELQGARLWGGPTDSELPLSLRLEGIARRGGREQPLANRSVTVTLSRLGRELGRWSGELGPDGTAEVTLPPAGGSDTGARVVVTASGTARPLANGEVRLPRDRWWSERRERGGPLPVPSRGPLTFRLLPARGIFAVPFAGTLWIELRERDQPAAAASLAARGEGLTVLEPAAPTNARGRTTLRLRPTAHVATLELEAHATSGSEGRWLATLPVVAGALDATRVGPHTLALSSPIPRSAAYVTLIDARGRHGGATVPLQTLGDGTARGRVTLPHPLPRDGWAVVSSERDLASPGAVGWPLADATAAWLDGSLHHPPRSVTLTERLWLDGVGAAQAREDERLARLRRGTGCFVALALALELALLLLHWRRLTRAGAQQLEAAAGERLARDLLPPLPTGLLALGAASLAVGLGFLLLGLLVWLRLR